jgi:CAAX prenyl protease-like protein
MLNHPNVPYIAPFLTFIAMLAIQKNLAFLGDWEYAVRVVIVGASIWFFSRRVLDFKVRYWAGSLGIGIAAFLLWIAPDTLFPGWRQHWLFTNSIMGEVRVSLSAEQLSSPLLLLFRTISAALMVPILEELFWRAWMLRWLVKTDFESLPMGSADRQSFWIVAALFAVEHGPYWEVGLLTGVMWNWWMMRTKSLGDLIFVHAVTNLILSLYVIWSKQWHFWM